jgi:hypothetical protein
VDTTQQPLQNSPSPLWRPGWKALLQDYPDPALPLLVDNILEFGTLLGYSGPEQRIFSKNLQSAQLRPEEITKKIADDLALGRIREVFPKASDPFICSPLGLVPKPNNKFRPIHHLSYPPATSVNDFIDSEAAYFRFVKFEEILAMILQAGQGCIMIKRDMKDAFRLIPIAPQHQWLMGLQWEGRFYQELVLPFGLRTAPVIFNVIAEAWEWILKSFLPWAPIKHYLDDTIGAFPASGRRKLTAWKSGYNLLCDFTGILRNDDKDDEGTLLIILGRVVDSLTRTVSIPQEKINRTIAAAKAALEKDSLTLLEAQELAGLVTFCASAVQLGFVFCRRLWTFIASYQRRWHKSYKRRLPAAVREDIQWWHDLFPTYNGVRFFDDSKREMVHLFADASVHGMGAFFLEGIQSQTCVWQDHVAQLPQDHAFAETLPPWDDTKPFDINIFEITALLRAFELWGNGWSRKMIILHTDSSTAHLGLVKQTLRSPEHNEPLRRLLLLSAHRDIKIEPLHIAGEDNGLADALSRDAQDFIANWCPHWQKSFHSLNHHQAGHPTSLSRIGPNSTSITVSTARLAKHTSPTKSLSKTSATAKEPSRSPSSSTNC